MLPSGAEGMKFCQSQGELVGVSVFTDSKDEAELFWIGFQLESMKWPNIDRLAVKMKELKV